MTHEQHENINKVKEVIKGTKYRAEILELKRIITEIKMTLEASLVAQMVKRLSAMQETRVQPLGWEDPLEKEMAAHSSILAWKIPWIMEPGRLPSVGSMLVCGFVLIAHFWNVSQTTYQIRSDQSLSRVRLFVTP